MQPIKQETVHRLCAGQVIVDLGTSVKELVENSLDAGATSVDIKLKDSGLTSIEVADNGSGIDEANYKSLCLKHWTSKLSTFEDLETVQSFGFRGEALSSLCAVSRVQVTTATRETAPAGEQLEYNEAGELTARKTVARERGTTVRLCEMFARWPVRQQEMKRNSKREFQRVVSLIEQYAVVSDGVRISLSNQTKAGTFVPIRTMPHSDRVTRLLQVFGAQMRPHLAYFKLQGEEEDGLRLQIDGHMSKPLAEAGRSAADKQFFFVNGRPCDFPKAKRLINEIYRSSIPTKYPVCAVFISINSSTIDVNLTPDKRSILLRHETQVLAALRRVVEEQVVQAAESAFSVNSRQQTTLVPMQEEQSDRARQPAESASSANSRKQTTLVPMQEEQGDRAMQGMHVAPTSVPGVVRCYVEDQSAANKDGRLQQKRAASESVESIQAPTNTRLRLTPSTDAEPPSKRLQTMVIGNCRNRLQNDVHDWKQVGKRMQAKHSRHRQQLEDSQQRRLDEDERVEHGGLGNCSAPEKASSALSQLIHKSDFAQMSIIGQFNRGFIVARKHHDLFIIDQHASDEKYNFEQLQQQAVISSQQLIRPQTLQLGVVDEAVAVEHQQALQRNGFYIEVDEHAEAGRRVRLVRQPVIDQTLFNQQDLLELIGKLCDSPESMPRCERARRMFASRACRKSIMIGDPLTAQQMKAVVAHLSGLDHPWNCPHGRPTMRHLYRLPTA
ncbi:ATP-binding mismatch repair protein [Coemansia sp. RSA 2336]|nr:ATP-binding mismatch repair protein [Coemansia sp. RSA 2336]